MKHPSGGSRKAAALCAFEKIDSGREWVQLSVFQCRLPPRRKRALEMDLQQIISTGEDHVLILDLGLAGKIATVTTLGKPFHMLDRKTIIV